MAIKIEVTAEKIANGKPEDSDSCPIALALSEVVGGDVYVDSSYMEWEDETGRRVQAETPLIASQFIHKFDANEPVEPFSFEVEPYEEHDEWEDDE